MGGMGGSSDRMATRDVRLAVRALGEHWEIPPEARRAMLDRLAGVVADPEARPRAFIAAARLLAGLSRANLTAVDTTIRAEAHEDLCGRLEALEARLGAEGGGRP